MKKVIKWYFTTIANYVLLASLAWFIVILAFFLLIDFPFTEEYWINSKFGWWLFNNFGVHRERGAFWSAFVVLITHTAIAWWIRHRYIHWISAIWTDYEVKKIWFKIILGENRITKSQKAVWRGQRILQVIKAPTSNEWEYGYISGSEPTNFEIHISLDFEDNQLRIYIPVQIKMKVSGFPSIQEILGVQDKFINSSSKSHKELKFDVNDYIVKSFFEANQSDSIKEMVIDYLRGREDFSQSAADYTFLELLTRSLTIPKLFSNFTNICLCVQKPQVEACKTMEENGQ